MFSVIGWVVEGGKKPKKSKSGKSTNVLFGDKVAVETLCPNVNNTKMIYRQLIVRSLAISFLASAFISNAHANPLSFFPSRKIHEDDRVSGEFHLQVNDCSFKLIEYFPNRALAKRIKITAFDLSYYETNPAFVNKPYSTGPLSTRYNVSWFAKEVNKTDMDNVKAQLRETRLSFADRRKLTSDLVIQKRLRMTANLKHIQNGDYGQFAADNHSETYIIKTKPELIAVTVSSAFVLPVERVDAQNLIRAVHDYWLRNCSEVVLD